MIRGDLVEKLKQAIASGDDVSSLALAQSVVENKVDVVKVVEELSAVMHDVGQKFERLEIFLSDLMLSAEAMKAAMSVFRPLLARARGGLSERSTIVIGTVQGDIHDIGKNIVSAMLTAAGFEVNDIGIDVPASKFVETAKEIGADIVASSALMTTTLPFQEEIIKQLSDQGVRQSIKVLVGGGAVTHKDADRMGADGFAPDAVKGVDEAKRLLSGRNPS